ncbi:MULTISPECIES: acyltransferase [Pseudoalteromonas]|uniref:Chloramphenicol acetyltransferase n=1 Tax=Pseudoalteromonas aliena TaxID=247523 RepID=A0A1Q2GWA8_9GAMM|nr:MULTISPECIES: acyltransferase [Pseudoalteromonas]AQP99428.1 galactoside O-acetyltransferase [Pseudoalteromonas aliena]MBE3672494.1 galactoside O-acetyltransferase [Pseudoalteromonas distincta KMM 3548]MDC3212110.1 acyltransferase [Pseudoalteromonas distincta]TMO04173.1 acyltransferase [Pseudoalteromonas sp. S558]
MAFYTQTELEALGFKYLGMNVKLSKLASIYNVGNIEIGDNSRIDDFCILSAGKEGICIGKHVHIGVYTSLIGAGRIVMEDYTCLSSKCSLYSSNDDYSGEFMTNPTVPSRYTNVSHASVTIKKHSLIGAGCVILPGVIIGECVAVGSLSLVNKSLESGFIYIGQPAKKIKKRSRNCEILGSELCLKG